MATEDMVERVANIIDETLGGLVDDDGGRLSNEIRRRMVEAAHAVFAEMRSPTDAMIAAGAQAPGDGNLDAAAINIWVAMVDAANHGGRRGE
jgi:hypothetical protein